MAKDNQDDSVSPFSGTPRSSYPGKPEIEKADPFNLLPLADLLPPPLITSSQRITDSPSRKGSQASNPDELRADQETASANGDFEAQDSAQANGGRSVQFAASDALDSPIAPMGQDEPDTPGKSRGAGFMSKLKAFTASSGTQTPRSPHPSSDAGVHSLTNSPTAQRGSNRFLDTHSADQSDADADIETADEAAIPEQGAPVSPDLEAIHSRLLRRRASMPDTTEHEHAASDGEIRDRPRRRTFRRGHSLMNITMGPDGDNLEELEDSVMVGRRTGHLRRLTVFGGGGVSDGDALTPKRSFFNSERASTFGVQKWKQVKSTLKLLRQKKEDRFDYYKSAELMAELRAGAPAVLMLASMIQRDEHGNKRIPVLLEQLKLKIKDSSPMPDDDKERHWIFTIELEYGSGPSRMNWTVIRTIRDIYNLHFRYKFAIGNEKYMLGRLELGARLKQPKFPYSAFPYLRGARDKGDDSDEEDQASIRGEETACEGAVPEETAEGVLSGGEEPPHPNRKKSRSNFLGMRRRSTGITDPGEASFAESQLNAAAMDKEARRQRYIDKQRRILEKYLSEMIRWLMFRADSNRLCRFLELSALGVRLAAEGSYHGKEGYLHIQSSKGLDFRRVLTPAKVIARHSRKWFLVRQSYIVCVESPENMNIYDVYLVDEHFGIVPKKNKRKKLSVKDRQAEVDLAMETPQAKHHTLTVRTSERKVRLFSRYQSVMRQFEDSIGEMLKQTLWSQEKRFGSFAPVRQGVFAQWLVDGRDYMWNVSRAINMARDVIYIHDWWLSPELYMRRPAAISQKWRLDRLLQKKAREGVKIFVIIYRNVEAAVPIDSEYTKFSLLNLHPNIFVQRSPNQFKKNQFFFAHHEKICVVDHDVAFVGGIDLCFGRWDSPQHPIVDDKPTGFEPSETPKDAEHCQLFPGKDYSNPRVQDFFRLNEPYEEMYDRSKVPRMPWHDVAMQVVGQPARDLTRHFVQRWNYLRRGRKPTRPLPFLLPPPDAKFEDLEALGLTGTCEVQILRSASNWSLGIEHTEDSIQTAYVKMIENSDHFVYMENQFFITSTEAYGTKIVNRIGDALVERIIRAHQRSEDWRCVIVIPLMPGFQNTVDEQEGTSVRLIVMCQYRSICRGEHSIFGRLRAVGIEPEDYISFYSLRQWGIMSTDVLVTEQLYIHAKAIIVDDRVALIGSANINERSMVGSRDSECAAIVRDTDMIMSTMAGKPYAVGRFAHTLRMRLMREHLGLDVDEILEQEREQELTSFEDEMEDIYADDATPSGDVPSSSSHQPKHTSLSPLELPSFNHDLEVESLQPVEDGESSTSKGKEVETDPRVVGNREHQMDLTGYGPDHWKAAERSGADEGRDSVIVNGREVLLHNVGTEGRGAVDGPKQASRSTSASHDRHTHLKPTEDRTTNRPITPASREFISQDHEYLAAPQLKVLPMLDDNSNGGSPAYTEPPSPRPTHGAFQRMAEDIKPALIDKDCMRDPIHPKFIDNIWNRAAANNTLLYRRVFRCQPDSKVGTWAEYREYTDYGVRFRASMEGRPPTGESEHHRESCHHRAQTPADGPPKSAGNGAEKAPPTPREEATFAGQEERPKIQLPEDAAEASEKKPIGDRSVEELSLRPPPSDGGASANHISLEPPSPIYPPGDIPFPLLETPSAKPVGRSKSRDRRTTFSTLDKPPSRDVNAPPPTATTNVGSVKRRRRATTKGSRRGVTIDDMPTRADAEQLLNLVQGNLVEFPYDWLLTEEHNGNWGFQVDGVAPIAIYN
ncbi:Phospholipase D1 [Cladobotryum mycophilum]|uniref:phospholipase D n=1 Tax=Cladobotryum mycophilum TaxID=491253 RepID=A0ABR0S798_9HYPO